MNGKGTEPFAFFARGIDGFYFPHDAGSYALVRAGTPEVDWARSFLPRQCVLPFATPRSAAHDPYPSTESLLLGGNIHNLLRSCGIKRLLLSSACQPSMQAWADEHGIRLLAARLEHQRRLENKIWFDRFLRRIGLPRPPGGAFTVGHKLPVGLGGRLVLQFPDSLGGEGTYFLNRPDDLPAIIARAKLTAGTRCLVRQFQPGVPLGITIFIAPGLIAVSAMRRQCYYPAAANAERKRFAGVQWLARDEISAKARRTIDRTMLRLGSELYRMRYFGVANVDLLLDSRDRVWLIECNPRMSAATPQLFAHPELCGMLPLGELFLQGFAGRRRYVPEPKRHGLPKSEFRGATLDVLPPEPVAVEIKMSRASGRYRTLGRQIKYVGPDIRGTDASSSGDMCLFSFAMRGHRAESDTMLATILGDQPLYDDGGNFNELATRLLAHFRYT